MIQSTIGSPEVIANVSGSVGYFGYGLYITLIYFIALIGGAFHKAYITSSTYIKNGSAYNNDTRSEFLARVLTLGMRGKMHIEGEDAFLLFMLGFICSIVNIAVWPITLVIMGWIWIVLLLRVYYEKKNG